MLIVADLASGLVHCLELAYGDPSRHIAKPLARALSQLAGGLLTVYAPEVPLDRILDVRGGPRDYPRDPSQGFRSQRAEELCGADLEAFPPLHVYMRTMECLGVLALQSRYQDRVLTPAGESHLSPRLPTRGLLFSSLRRLADSFRHAFPQTPWEEPRLSRLELEFLPRWGAGFAPVARATMAPAWREATGVGFMGWWHAEAARGIKLTSRLAFWKSSEPKERERLCDVHRRTHLERLRQIWEEMIAGSVLAAEAVPEMVLRDGILRVVELIPKIHTDSGNTQDCHVHGREEVEAELRAVRQHFRHHYGLSALLGDFFRELRTPGPVGRADRLGTGPVSAPALLGALRARFTAFRELERLEELRKLHSQVSVERALVDAQIGFWDRVNVFKSTPEKARRGELSQSQQELQRELASLDERVTSDFFRAAEVYPPLVLHLLTQPVERAVAAIFASSSQSTERDSEGREETRYSCTLHGQKEAVKTAAEWAQEFHRQFGALPGPAQLIELWAT